MKKLFKKLNSKITKNTAMLFWFITVFFFGASISTEKGRDINFIMIDIFLYLAIYSSFMAHKNGYFNSSNKYIKSDFKYRVKKQDNKYEFYESKK